MSKKRYYKLLDGRQEWVIRDRINRRIEYRVGRNKSYAEKIVDLLNEQQATITALKEENKQLKEQLQMIERIIQTQITEKEEDLRTSVKGGMPTGGLYSEIEFLKKLKKECFDE